MQDTVDFSRVPEHQLKIHGELENWARWVKPRKQGWTTHPMWRQCRTSRQWDIQPHISQPVNTRDAVAIERTVSAMPEKHREALRWYYVKPGNPRGQARLLGLSVMGLHEHVVAGRTMAQNNLQPLHRGGCTWLHGGHIGQTPIPHATKPV